MPDIIRELNHLLSGSNCLYGQFDLRFYDISPIEIVRLISETLNAMPDRRGPAKEKKSRRGAVELLCKLAIPEQYRYYNSDSGQWEIVRYKRAVDLVIAVSAEFNDGYRNLVHIICRWESTAKEFKPAFLDIINRVHDDIYEVLCRHGKLDLMPPKLKSSATKHKGKSEEASSDAAFTEYAVSVYAWDFEERINRFICKFVDDASPVKRSALQQYWWDIVYDFMQDRRVHLELSRECPLYKNHNGLNVRFSVHFESSSDYTRRYIFSVNTDGNPISQLIADATIADMTQLFSRHLNYRSGSVLQYIYASESSEAWTGGLIAHIKEQLLHNSERIRGRGRQAEVNWQQEFHELEQLGELRLFCTLGIRLVFRVGESSWSKQDKMIPLAADWIIFADPVPIELSEIISDTVTTLFHRFGRKNKKTSQYDSWDFDEVVELRKSQAAGRARWPTPQEYQEAMQNAVSNLLDIELKEADVQLSNLGLPQAISGGFASVYKLTSADSREWAVRCFLNPIRDQELRYSQISRFIESDSLPYTVGFEYVPDGVLVNGRSFPLVKMPWVKGESLNIYLSHRYGNAETVEHLRRSFHKMHLDLLQEGMAHCDLQHGNILIQDDQLFLVDYDNVFIQPLEGMPSNELGHLNYQHPARDRSDYGLYLDNFSAWIIDTTFLCLLADPLLWKKYNGGDECLLFRRADFVQPDHSQLFAFMEKHEDQHLRERAGTLKEFLKLRPSEIPQMDPLPS